MGGIGTITYWLPCAMINKVLSLWPRSLVSSASIHETITDQLGSFQEGWILTQTFHSSGYQYSVLNNLSKMLGLNLRVVELSSKNINLGGQSMIYPFYSKIFRQIIIFKKQLKRIFVWTISNKVQSLLYFMESHVAHTNTFNSYNSC